MLPESTASPEASKTVKMLAIIEQRNTLSGCHADLTDKYLLLMLFKLGMDIAVIFLCCRKPFHSFLAMCSSSIVLADSLMVFLIAHIWFLGPERYPVSLCFLMAYASAAYGALPLPIICLGLLDYFLEDTYLSNQRACCKFLRNAVLTLLVWMLAVIYTFWSVQPDLMEMDFENGIKALVCEVEESTLIDYLILGVFAAVIFTMLPFWSMIPQWMKEAERLSEAREERDNQSSDLLFTSTCNTETKIGEENYLQDTVQMCPPLWASLTMGFGAFWMPYLSVSVACLIFGFAVPSYITVNLLWLECTNSLLMGVVFWVKSKKQGPYSNLPENVCMWHVYWHLSKGAQHRQLPMAVFNPSKEKRNTLLYV
ncbi:probable G-protein coupled receptor 160 [Centropristis striata]|uniref:probable G-protein coupled receptor 160 n=1 Tax=Centropristis striata TaxID=184440 RepID=UPI0027DECD6C|nr:probable G-protein coupled receptor 160 [Centropristis striata]XP_059189633.1 probable G-protein coupled receptor 160 [Centropristis striata]XP_059189634.1 probable G-protein coupled receptor 160 [Centropristis striata]